MFSCVHTTFLNEAITNLIFPPMGYPGSCKQACTLTSPSLDGMVWIVYGIAPAANDVICMHLLDRARSVPVCTFSAQPGGTEPVSSSRLTFRCRICFVLVPLPAFHPSLPRKRPMPQQKATSADEKKLGPNGGSLPLLGPPCAFVLFRRERKAQLWTFLCLQHPHALVLR